MNIQLVCRMVKTMGCQCMSVEAAGIRPSLTLPRTYNKAWLNAAFFLELTARSCDGSSDTIMQHGDVYSSFQVPWKNLGSCTCANRSSLRFLATWEQGYGETNWDFPTCSICQLQKNILLSMVTVYTEDMLSL